MPALETRNFQIESIFDGVSDWFYNARTGTLSPGQRATIAGQVYVDEQQAGASDQEAMDAALEAYDYAPRYYPARGPFETLGSDFGAGNLRLPPPLLLGAALFVVAILLLGRR